MKQIKCLPRVTYSFAAPLVIAVCASLMSPIAMAKTNPGTIPTFTSAAALTKQCDSALKEARLRLRKLENPALLKLATPAKLASLNNLAIFSEDSGGPAYLIANVHPDKVIRDAGDACYLKWSEFETETAQNEKVFALVNSIKPADAVQTKLKADLQIQFEDSGVSLAPVARTRAKAIAKKMEELSSEYSRNIRDNATKVTVSEAELKGLAPAYIAALKKDDQGRYLIGLDYPQYVPFMENAETADARRRVQFAYTQLGTARNLDILSELGKLRQELAGLHGSANYAQFVTKRRMVQNPETVIKFLDQVKATVQAVEKTELETLRAFKAKYLGQALEATKFERWDLAFYEERYKSERFKIDQASLRKYFPAEASVQWALSISETLYNVKFVETAVPVWHKDVRFFEVQDKVSNKIISSFYLDLYPREGKYNHAAAFPFRGASQVAGRQPSSALVTNFNREGFSQDELVTLVHEFGHVLHGVLTRTRYLAQSGTSVERDFVEAPSQMYEAWARRLESLQLIANFCKGCPRVDADLVKRLREAESFGRSIQYSRQHLYASYDMTLGMQADTDPIKLWAKMEADTPLGHVPGTQLPGNFGHLAGGYASGYYGYMWSEVLAQDMLSAFGNNLMDPIVGKRYLDTVLGQGSEQKAGDMVRTFLGREPNPKAFFDEITGGKR